MTSAQQADSESAADEDDDIADDADMQMRLQQAQLHRPLDPHDPGYDPSSSDISDQDEQHQANRDVSSVICLVSWS